MSKQIRYDMAASPDDVIDRLASETVPFQSVLNLRSPVASYGTWLKESFTGDKEFLAKIDGHRFRVTTIGLWPFKGTSPATSWLTYVGAMHGSIRQSSNGSTVQTQFRMFPIFLILMIAASCLVGVMAILAILVLVLGAEMEMVARIVVWAISGLFSTFALTFAGYILFAARFQERRTRAFLDRFCSEIAP
jgi:hypothetical protein